MTKKTEPVKKSLTPEEEAARDACRVEYLAHGWSTEPSDRQAAEEAICALYERARKLQSDASWVEKLKDRFARTKDVRPKFVWFDSPLAAVKTIYESTGERRWLSGTDGCIDSYWVAFYKFCSQLVPDVVKPEDLEHLEEWDKLVKSTGPCWPYTNYCLMSERPVIARKNANEVLHCEDGPALQYRDGFSIYAVNGVRVPEVVIMRPWEMTLEYIEDIKSADVQTIALQNWCYEEISSTGGRVGANGGRWLDETGAEQVAVDTLPGYKDCVIMRALMRDREGRQFLICNDSSTKHVYCIRVSSESRTCSEAHASVNGGISDAAIRMSS